MKTSTSSRGLNIAGAVILILGLWFLLSLFNEPLVIPPVGMVFSKVLEILSSPKTIKDIFITLERLVLAMVLSILGGLGLGILCGILLPSWFKNIIKEMMKIFQVVPPVAVLIMAIMWFGLNGIPAVFIVVASIIPLISIQTMDAIDNIDFKLVEMGRVFKLSKLDMIRNIYLPSIKPGLWSSIIISLTIGAKLLVMGEVLTISTGIGGKIAMARLNIEPETVIAWTIIMMCLYYMLESLLNFIKKH